MTVPCPLERDGHPPPGNAVEPLQIAILQPWEMTNDLSVWQALLSLLRLILEPSRKHRGALRCPLVIWLMRGCSHGVLKTLMSGFVGKGSSTLLDQRSLLYIINVIG